MTKTILNQNRSRLARRLAPVFLFFIFFLLVVGGRLIYLQVFMGSEMTRQSEANRIRHQIIPAQRGMILDRRGTILAADEPIFHLAKESEFVQLPASMVAELAGGLKVDTGTLSHRLVDADIRFLVRGLSDSQRIWFAENDSDYPGLRIRILPERKYHHGPITASILGYTGEISPAELRRRRGEGLSQGSIVGKTGIEEQYDRHLRGADGIRWIETSARGEYLRTLESPSPTSSVPGENQRLNIDFELQREIVHSFPADSAGVAIVMEIPSGKIRAMHSHPTFDPNKLIISGRSQVKELLSRKGDPLHNRVTQSRFPPGSTFKLIPFLSALDDPDFQPDREYYCGGQFQLGIRTFKCWKEGGHGMLSLTQGLVHSCNVYFYRLIQDLDYRSVISTARDLRFNRRTQIDLPGEKSSQLSTPKLKQNRYGGQWVKGDEVNAVIGQGYTLISPIKQAQLLGSILTDRIIQPRVADLPTKTVEPTRVRIDPSHRERLIRTMDEVTDEGTGYWAQHDTSYQRIEPDIIGKTGTVQKIKLNDEEDTPPSDAWFVSAAPADNPKYVVVVFRIEGGSGGQVAAPHARHIYQTMNRMGYFDRKAPQGRAVSLPENQN